MLEPGYQVRFLIGRKLLQWTAQYRLAEEVAEFEHAVVWSLSVVAHCRVVEMGRQTRIAVEQAYLVKGLRHPGISPEDVLATWVDIEEREVDVGSI